MKCQSCGAENAEDVKRCASCSAFLGEVLAASAQPSEDEVPTNLPLALLSAGLPVLCVFGSAFSLLALPVAGYAVWQARQVEDLAAGRDVPGAVAASINAKRYALLAMAIAVLGSLVGAALRSTGMGDAGL